MTRLLILLLISVSAEATITKLGCSPGSAPNMTPGNSGTLDIRGATLLTITFDDGEHVLSPSVADQNGNTFTSLVQYYTNAASSIIYYSYAKGSAPLSVSASDFATVTGYYSYFTFCAWTGTYTYPTNPLDQATGNTTGVGTGTTLNTGSVTTLYNGELIISTFATSSNAGTYSVDSSLTITNQSPFVGGTNFGGANAWYIQPSAGAINPLWRLLNSSSGQLSASIATFRASPVSPVVPRHRLGIF